MERKKIDIEMADMVGKTYFKIATWFNKDFESDKERQDALKHTAAEIIQQVLEDTFLQMDGVVKTESKTVSQGTPKTTINQTETISNVSFIMGEELWIKVTIKDSNGNESTTIESYDGN